jgi:hypothetical protein
MEEVHNKLVVHRVARQKEHPSMKNCYHGEKSPSTTSREKLLETIRVRFMGCIHILQIRDFNGFAIAVTWLTSHKDRMLLFGNHMGFTTN